MKGKGLGGGCLAVTSRLWPAVFSAGARWAASTLRRNGTCNRRLRRRRRRRRGCVVWLLPHAVGACAWQQQQPRRQRRRDGDADSNCRFGGGGGGGGGNWCSRESERLLLAYCLLLRWSPAYLLHGCSCSAAEAAPAAPVAPTAASGGRVVGLPPMSTGVSLGAWRSTRSRGPTEVDDCKTPAGGKAVCWRKFQVWIRLSAV